MNQYSHWLVHSTLNPHSRYKKNGKLVNEAADVDCFPADL